MSDALVRAQRQLMSDWSENNWCAGWLVGLEELIWNGSGKELDYYDQEIIDIHEIAKMTGVWLTYDATVPISEWEAKHGPPLAHMADEEPTPEQRATLERLAAEYQAWLQSTERFWNR